ncbi:MAG: DUF4424 family protein [Ancalomicrobiaceae bacterium]|nr:DUF4424 family protein [Ancalomicrobiaceae bacterium]
MSSPNASSPNPSCRLSPLRAGLAAALAALVAAPATANDSTAQIGAGGLVLVPNAGVSMQSEDLRLSVNSIDIDYVFKNDTDADITTLVAFPLPKLSGNDEDFTVQLPKENDPIDFIGFSIEVDGKKVSPQVEQRASVVGIDITDRLKADGIPVNPFSHTGAREQFAKLPADKRAFYESHGLAFWSEGQPGGVSWDVSTTFYWMQTFPAKKEVKVHHSYHPIIGGSFLTESSVTEATQLARLTRTYCADTGTINGIKKALATLKQKSPDNSILSEQRLDYVLSTGANWGGAIGTFKLTIDKPSADAIMTLCFPGKFQKVSPTRFTYTATDFVPDQDLSILFASSGTQQ